MLNNPVHFHFVCNRQKRLKSTTIAAELDLSTKLTGQARIKQHGLWGQLLHF